MTNDSHNVGSGTIHRRMSNEEFDRELTEIKLSLDVLMELLWEGEKDQRCRWTLTNKVK